MSLDIRRLSWLAKRLSRISFAEIPYRVGGVMRAAAQKRGHFDASRPPARAGDARFGRPWVQRPHSCDSSSIVDAANRILTEGVEVFDVSVPVGEGHPDWNRDPKTGREIPRIFGLDIDFRHLEGGVDIKYLWELNRHLWWVPIAQAYAVTGDDKYLNALARLLDSWLAQCPYPLGANWSSPVEHGIRLINWSIVWHLIGGSDAAIFCGEGGLRLLDRWLASIYQHIRFAGDNYSFHSSADNHLIGEAAGVFVGAHTWDLWPEVRALRRRAKAILERETLKQFSGDGVNLEQAICYHKFSLEFLLASLLCGMANDDDYSPDCESRLLAALEYLAAMMDCRGNVPAIGDSDDGKVFSFVGDGAGSAYEALLRIGAAVFASPALAWKLDRLGVGNFEGGLWPIANAVRIETGPMAWHRDLPQRFERGGYLLLGHNLHSAEEFRVVMDVGPLGYNRIAGHGHADALAVLLSCRGRAFLIDPGTYCYNASPELRHYFRGTSAHNTMEIDDLDQSVYGGSFLWLQDMATTIHRFDDEGGIVTVEASHDGYLRLDDPVRHIRKLTFDCSTFEFLVEDRVECAKRHSWKIHWHFAPDCTVAESGAGWTATSEAGRLAVEISPNLGTTVVAGRESPTLGWVSARFYEKRPTPVLVVEGDTDRCSAVTTRFRFGPSTSPTPFQDHSCVSGSN
jgi:hypothetical protein